MGKIDILKYHHMTVLHKASLTISDVDEEVLELSISCDGATYSIPVSTVILWDTMVDHLTSTAPKEKEGFAGMNRRIAEAGAVIEWRNNNIRS